MPPAAGAYDNYVSSIGGGKVSSIRLRSVAHSGGELGPGKPGIDYVVTGIWLRANKFAAPGARPCGGRGKALRRTCESLAAGAANLYKVDGKSVTY